MPRPKPTASDLDDADDHPEEVSVQRIVPANTAPWPASTAPNSVFDAGRIAKAAAAPRRLAAIDIVIRHGVPKPVARNGMSSVYRDAMNRMKPGDSIELPTRHAKAFYVYYQKRHKSNDNLTRFSYRKVSATHGAIWRDADSVRRNPDETAPTPDKAARATEDAEANA